LYNPSGVAVDGSGNVIIADTGNHRIRRVDARTRVITTVVEGSVYGIVTDPMGVAVDTSGNMFITDHRNSRIQRVDARTRDITTVAGNGNWWEPNRGFSGDGGAGTSAMLHYPYGVAVDRAGNVFIADTHNHRIRRVDARTGIITTVAGNGTQGFSGDGRPATSASLHYPSGVAVDNNGNLFISDMRNNRIRKVNGPFT
jgi:DNA-binding beta-propeller fold protein YncE